MRIRNFGLILIMSALLSACGFKPMHAPNAFGGKGLTYSNISVQTVNEEKIDFLLKQALRGRMGANSNTPYTLKITPKLTRRTLGISADDVASRYDLVMDAKFELIDNKTGKSVFKDKVRAISTFGAPSDPYGTIAAQNNATEQVAAETADRILVRLTRYDRGR